jgi:hypothetical protein
MMMESKPTIIETSGRSTGTGIKIGVVKTACKDTDITISKKY